MIAALPLVSSVLSSLAPSVGASGHLRGLERRHRAGSDFSQVLGQVSNTTP